MMYEVHDSTGMICRTSHLSSAEWYAENIAVGAVEIREVAQ